MIIQKTVIVPLTSVVIRRYEKLGYYIPRHKNSNQRGNKLFVKEGTKIEVKVSDLPKGSSIKVLYKCDNCGKENLSRYNHLSKKSKHFCTHCAFCEVTKSGKESYFWKHEMSDEERYTGRNRNHLYFYQKAVRQAKKRDGKCLVCGSKEKIQGHHIKDYKHFPELRCEPDNIVTLCYQHHTAKNGISIHSIYGKHPTEENWNEYKSNFSICLASNYSSNAHPFEHGLS